MKNEQQNLTNNNNQGIKTSAIMTEDINTDQIIPQNQPENDMMQYSANGSEKKANGKTWNKSLIFGGICIVVSMIAFHFTAPSADTSVSAKNALQNKISTSVSAGAVLLSKDEDLGAKDYTITHNSDAKQTKIWVWDYGGEDGDYVQVFVDGTPISDVFMIMHKPKEFIVPATGIVQVKGIRDGGGGITYAVRYEINGTSYFNGATEGAVNTYTLKK